MVIEEIWNSMKSNKLSDTDIGMAYIFFLAIGFVVLYTMIIIVSNDGSKSFAWAIIIISLIFVYFKLRILAWWFGND